MRKLLLMGVSLVVTTAAVLVARKRRAVPRNERPADWFHMGIADVDPQPITQIAGEGVDLPTVPGGDAR